MDNGALVGYLPRTCKGSIYSTSKKKINEKNIQWNSILIERYKIPIYAIHE